MKLILITGMSGSGKGVALRALEDNGFEAMDNLPLSLIEDVLGSRSYTDIAIDVDVRNRDFSPTHFLEVMVRLRKNSSFEIITIYLDCDDEVIRKRYTETRRPHPLAADRPVLDGIKLERSLLQPIKSHADLVVDTSETTSADLRRIISGNFAANSAVLGIYITSFSFKHGVPRESDLVFDVRFLRNPHYSQDLREKTGLDDEVGNYIKEDKDFEAFFSNLCALIMPLLSRYVEEGKRYLTIAIGCTGGKHRSVYVARCLNEKLLAFGQSPSLTHRDIYKS